MRPGFLSDGKGILGFNFLINTLFLFLSIVIGTTYDIIKINSPVDFGQGGPA